MKRVVQKIQHLKNISQVIASGDHTVTVKNVLNALEKQTKEDLSYLEKNLLKIFPLFGLIKKSQKSQQKFNELISQLQIEHFQNNQVIFQKGDIGRKMYFVLSGHLLSFPYDCRDINNHTANKELNVGDHFGEISLQHRIPRTLTVISKGEVILLSSTVDKILTDQYKFIRTLSIFQDWNEFTIQLILHHLEEQKIQRNQHVYNEGNKDQNLYIIKFGEVILQKQYTVNQKKSENGLICLGQGQCFGDFEFIDNQSWLQNRNTIKEITRQMDAKSTTESLILSLPFLTYIRIQEEYHSSTLHSFLSTSKQVVIQRMKILQQQIINKKIKLDEESERKEELSELRMFKDQKQEEKQPQIVNDTSKIRHSNNPYISLMGTIKNNKNKEHQQQPSLQIDQIANHFSQKSILMKFDRGHKILLLKKLRDASILPDVKDNFIYQQSTVRSSCSRLRMNKKYQQNNQQDSVTIIKPFVNSRSHTPDSSVVLQNEFKTQNEINKCQRAFTFKLNDFHNFKVSSNSVGYSRSISQMSISRSSINRKSPSKYKFEIEYEKNQSQSPQKQPKVEIDLCVYGKQ
ncbi:unnamed protein product (macronuclear) [Paramecium tetraurelia]|uniref:Cyclic nucleotide-binding domain-containing protein n=1 Tax=Paramecium tetraurelia TaxID=5888 RepID=A0DW63_PARTE|nr:uncharacterized protein GSPATT00020933001 [Paramecium tetraurelia]CAK87280.1 unnamed protein product [Paramecium tetraurelia]|eukprot:XP_001454677.1 hypothetical protein (macronuclear) [Paramecium tetraurelia strain d4-2]